MQYNYNRRKNSIKQRANKSQTKKLFNMIINSSFSAVYNNMASKLIKSCS